MFDISRGQGFRITFANGWTVSVQFGPGHYCSRKGEAYSAPKQAAWWESKDAETAVINPAGELVYLDCECDQVRGWQTAEDVADLIARVRTFAPDMYAPTTLESGDSND